MLLYTVVLQLASGIVIDYTIENFVTGDGRVFDATLKMETTRKPFIDIMDEAVFIDYRYRYYVLTQLKKLNSTCHPL